jgi:nucleoid DNA-binding protein
MNTRQTVTRIGHRLPDLRKRDIQNVLDVLTELWRAELATPDGEIHLTGLGKLYVETHALRSTGVVRQALIQKYGGSAPVMIQRRVVRFRPYEALRTLMKEEGNHE